MQAVIGRARPTVAHEQEAGPFVLRGKALLVARVAFAAWALLAAVVLVWFNHSLDQSYLEEHLQGWPRPEVLREGMDRLNLPLDLVAYTNLISIYVMAAFSFGLAGLLMWRRSDQVVVLVMAAFLIASACAVYPPIIAEVSETNRLKALSAALVTLPFPAGMVGLMFVFPDGRFVPRWAKYPVLAAFAYLAFEFLVMPQNTSVASGIIDAIALAAVLGLALMAMIYRFRTTTDPATIRQLRTVGLGLALYVATFIGFNIALDVGGLDDPGFPPLLAVLMVITPIFSLTQVLLWALLVAALLKHRLFDIELVLSRTLALVGLTAGVVLVYLGVVAGAAAVFHSSTSGYIAVVGAVAVALLFQPMRSRMQSAANRLLYGQRSEPYEVLSQLSQRMESAADADEVPASVVRAITETLKLPYASITTSEGRLTAESGNPAPIAMRAPIVHRGEAIGQLNVAPWPGTPLNARDRRLVEDLASNAGAAIHAVALRNDLLLSRERLVNAREEERRRIRRDLHDGLGPRLASLMMRIETERDRSDGQHSEVLNDLADRLNVAITDIRRLVYGLRPPALDDLGLVGALEQAAAMHNAAGGPAIQVKSGGLPTLPAAVEVAAFRIAEEAMANAIKHSHASSCEVSLTIEDGELVVTSIDDGVGLPGVVLAGVGLRSMRERAEELGGRFEIEAVGPGTVVRAAIPIARVPEAVTA